MPDKSQFLSCFHQRHLSAKYSNNNFEDLCGWKHLIYCKDCLGSAAGSVIQATGRTDFEDGSRTGTKLEVRNGLQSVRTIPEVNMVSPLGPAMTPGAVWGHNSRIRVEADQSPTCQVPRNQWY